MTMAAVVMLCMETMPTFSGPRCIGSREVDPFFVGETVCTAWFTVEFLIRLASCPSKRSFFCDFKNVIDFISIVPFYVSLCLDSGREVGDGRPTTGGCDSLQSGYVPAPDTSLSYLRVIRLVRVVRIFKLTKYCIGLQVTFIVLIRCCHN